MKTDLAQRTKRFALDVIRYCAGLPREQAFAILGRQLMRSATSVGANYRAACRARSRADFVSKLGIVEEEVDEAAYWLELLAELQAGRREELGRLRDEATQLTAIVVASRKTARKSK